MRKKAKVEKAENHERWLLTYADLITLLLVFFIVLYAGSTEDAKKFEVLADGMRSAFNNPAATTGAGGTSAVFTGSGSTNAGGTVSQAVDFQSISAVIDKMAQERGLADRINLRMEADRIVIGLTSDLLFTSGSSSLRPSAAPVLDAVAESLRGRPNEIRIEGHTDNVPINTLEYNSNWELSSARATAVLRRFVDEGRMSADRVFAAAYGDSRPRADNATPVGRATNRRAEIVVLYPPEGVQLPPTVTPSRR